MFDDDFMNEMLLNPDLYGIEDYKKIWLKSGDKETEENEEIEEYDETEDDEE